MSNQFVATKFHIPPWRATAVSRPRLRERLTAGLRDNRKLTLVSAPAGYGKTTLITDWLHALAQADDDRRSAWLALGAADNDPARFLYHWLAAFQQFDAALNKQLQSLVNLPHLPPTTVLLDTLLNALAAQASPLLLTLDDDHVITHPDIHAALDYFIEHQPAHVHLVLTTRADPPLPLARLRARGQMTEIRVRDLRFTPEEAHQFFADALNLPLDAEALQGLDERTDGWAAGLHLAGLALQNQPDFQRFIATFAFWFAGAYVSFLEDINGRHMLLLLPGMIAPFIISLIMTFTAKDPAVKRDYINRLLNPRLFQLRTLPVFIFLMPLAVLTSTVLSLPFGGSLAQFQLAEEFSFSSGFVPVLLLLLMAATFEELGWRGYAFDSLQSRYTFFTASLIFGILWSLWHFPLIFVKDSYQYAIFNENIWFGMNFFRYRPAGYHCKLVLYQKPQKYAGGNCLPLYYQYVTGDAGDLPGDQVYRNLRPDGCGDCNCAPRERAVFLERASCRNRYTAA
jgi:membrane protease YdiL (CAAX protease family)